MNDKLNEIYEVIQHRPLEDVQSDGLLLKHKKSGAHICVLSNTDENKVFFIGFRTPPRDNTGIPHIIEHTVLCGSRKYPMKDPFIELVKGSMNTFLNAITYPDKTLYPVASCNDRDFDNLMDVYLDSVFYPNIYKNKNIFRQEGWHYELKDKNDPLTINGIVYNEMKGAFSSAEGMLDREVLRSLYPDTSYSMESGGDPDEIPNLTYEQYLDFHRTYYHPSNSYIYLYGDMNVEEKLQWLDDAYLSHFDNHPVDSALKLQAPFDKPAEVVKKYSIASTESEKNNTYLSCNWSVGTNLDPYQYVSFDLLEYALLSSPAAPVKRALIDAGIGDDIYGGYDSGLYQPVFSITAKDAEASQKEEFLRIIDQVLRDQVKNGISKRTLLAALNTSEFKFREADYGRIPKGLMLGIQVMDSWLYDENQPFLHLDELKVYDFLRRQLDTDYYEQLVEKYLIQNTHRSVVLAVPEKGLNEKKAAALQKKLDDYKASLSEEEVMQLVKETKELHDFGEKPSTPEELASIPMLGRDDMKKKTDPFSNELKEQDGVKMLLHDYDTNGIIYADLMFDIHHISEEDIPYLGILRRLMGRMDTTDYSYEELSDEIYVNTGGIHSEVNLYSDVTDPDRYQAKYEVRIRTLSANYDKAIKLAKSMMLHSVFTDTKRIGEILAETKSRLQAELSESGHVVSLNRALSYYSGRARYSDMVSGIAFFRTLEKITGHFEEYKDRLQEKLKELTEKIFCRENLLFNVTCCKEDQKKVLNSLEQTTKGLHDGCDFTPVEVAPNDRKNEGFMDASQIQYVSLAGRYDAGRIPYHGAMRIFKSIMSYDYLWTNIRVKGGAYGCSAGSTRNGDVYFTSYRDPNLSKTLEVYRNVPEYLRHFTADEHEMTKFVIGTFSEMDAPLTPMSKGRRSLTAWLTGLTWDMAQKEREEVLKAQPKDIRNLAGAIEEAQKNGYLCVIGNEGNLRKEENLFDHLDHLVSEKEEA